MGLNDFNSETHGSLLEALMHELSISINRNTKRAKDVMYEAAEHASDSEALVTASLTIKKLIKDRLTYEETTDAPVGNWCDVAKVVIALARLNEE